MPFSLLCCGLIGTMVDDGGMVDHAYAEAIATQGVVSGTAAYARCMAQLHEGRGQPAVDVLRAMFPDSQARAQAAQLVLDRSFADAIGRMGVTPVPGAAETMEKLAGAGMRICLITSFSRRVLTTVLDTLGWWDRVDLALCPQDVPRGSPWPDLVLSAMLRLGVRDVRETAVAHDAEAGILTGRRAGAGLVAGVLTGAHSGNRLRRAGASHLIPTIAHLPGLLQGGRDPAPGSTSSASTSASPPPASDAAAGGRPPASRPALECRQAGTD
jgi:phosphoglycolate phosphatase